MKIDLRYPIRANMNGKVKQTKPWHTGRVLGSNLLIYVVDGRLKLRIGSEEYAGKKGTAFLIPARTKYAPTEASELEYLFFHFNVPDTDVAASDEISIGSTATLPAGEYAYTYSVDAPSVISVPVMTDTEGDRRVTDLTNRILHLNVWSSNSEKLLLDCYLREFLILLCTGGRNRISRNLAMMLQYIEKNFSSDISISVLSGEFGFSASYIARLFKNELGTTSSDYINRLRVGKACDMLANSDMRISEISEKVGFSEQYYFSRVFRKVCGLSPLEFRQKNRYT